MKTYKTPKGVGWRDVPPIEAFSGIYRSIRDEVYEIDNCLRTMTLVEMRNRLQAAVDRMNDILHEINDDDTVVDKKKDY
jgi:hypothetical protein